MVAHRPTTRLFVRAISVVVLLAVAVALSSWRFSVVESEYDEMYADANQGVVGGIRRRGIDAVLETTAGPSSSGCAEVAHAKDQCSYLQAGNCEPDGYINYLELYYCTFSSVHIVCLALFVLLLVLLFFMLGTSAEDYFCPTLGVISDVLRLSPDVAGITILALGNGAPDVFSTFVAVTGGKFSIAIGELTGAGVFVSLVVVGAVTTVSSAKVEMLPFLRDVLFYLGASVVMLVIIITGHFYIYESALAIVVYVVYVSLSIVMNILKNRREARLKRERAGLDSESEEPRRSRTLSISYTGGVVSSPTSSTTGTLAGPYGALAALERRYEESLVSQTPASSLEMPVEKPVGPAKELLLQWIARWEWSEKSILQKVVTVITFPVTIVFDVTIPQVQEDTYFRLYNCASAVFSPLLLMLAFDPIVSFYGTSWAGGWIPLWACVEVGAIVVGFVVFFTTETNNLPRYNYVFVGWAFFISIVWIYLIANELVSLLEAVGLILNISPSLLGMTVLAWGNSIGDLVSNVVVAKQGAPSMAIAACFGGPLFNMLIGLGTSLTYRNILDYPNPYNVTLPTTIFNSFLFVIISMVSTLIVVPLSKFTFRRPYAIYTISLYVFYTVINLLVEFDVISDTLTIGQN